MWAGRTARHEAMISAQRFVGGEALAHHHFGGDERAGDRVLAREDAARADRRVGVERRLDLFGMNLGAADVDDPAAPADEDITIAAALDHVAAVDEALGVVQRRRVRADVAQRRAVRFDAQRAVDDLHRDLAALFEQRSGKAGAAVADGERDARFGGGVGVLDARVRIERAQGGEHGVVGDLAREPHGLGIDAARLSAHQNLAPMRRRARNVLGARFAQADEVIVDALAGAAQVKRLAPRERAQEDLQAAVAANVVERRPGLRWRGAEGAGQGRERVDDHLRRAAGARSRHHPFGGEAPAARRGERFERQAARDREIEIDLRRRFVAVIDQRVRLRPADQRFKAGPVEAGRAEHDAAREAVELDQRRGGLGHVADGERDRAPFEAVEFAAEARRVREIVERQPPIARRDRSAAAGAGRHQLGEGQRLRQGLGRRRRSGRRWSRGSAPLPRW